MTLHPAVMQRIQTASNPHWWLSGPHAVSAACVVVHHIVGDDGALVALAGHASDLRQELRGVWQPAQQCRLPLGEIAPALGMRLVRELLESLARALPQDQSGPALEGVEQLIDEMLRDHSLTGSGRLLELLFIPEEQEDVVVMRHRVTEACHEFGLGPPHWQCVYDGGTALALVVIPDPQTCAVCASLGAEPIISQVHRDIERRALEMTARERYPQATDEAIAEWAASAVAHDVWSMAWRQGRPYHPAGPTDQHEIRQRLLSRPATMPLVAGYEACCGGTMPMPQWWEAPQVCLDLEHCARQRIEIIEELLYEAATQPSQVCRAKALLIDAHTWQAIERSTIAERLARDGRKYRVSVVVCASGPAGMPDGPMAEHIGNTLLLADDGGRLCGIGAPLAVGHWYDDDDAIAARLRVGGMT